MKQVWEVKDNANAYFKYLVISSVRYYEPCAASRSNPRPARQLYYAGGECFFVVPPHRNDC